MLNAFVTLFSQADFVFYIIYIFALGLFISRIFVQNHFFLSLAGFVMAVGAITERCVVQENTSTQIIFYIIYSVLLMIAVYSIVKITTELVVANKTRKKMAKVKGNNVPLTEEGNPDYSFLLGKVGMVVSDLKPTGKVEIQGSIYEVSSINDYINAGCIVKVVKVLVSRVFVEKQ